jgi:hypothetical protein
MHLPVTVLSKLSQNIEPCQPTSLSASEEIHT